MAEGIHNSYILLSSSQLAVACSNKKKNEHSLYILTFQFLTDFQTSQILNLERLKFVRKKAYEISKSLDFEWDFVISELISRFQEEKCFLSK